MEIGVLPVVANNNCKRRREGGGGERECVSEWVKEGGGGNRALRSEQVLLIGRRDWAKNGNVRTKGKSNEESVLCHTDAHEIM